MKRYYLVVFLGLFLFGTLGAQVGINTTEPKASLDVQGDARFDDHLFLEEPGAYNIIRGSKLLINTTADEMLQYDIEQSKYGPINYVQFAFKNTNTIGLEDYNTKISTADYLVTVQGYYFTGPNGNTNIMPHSRDSDGDIEGFQMYAYPNAETGTWFLRGKFNNASFRAPTGSGYGDVKVDIYMNLIIYRNKFISKPQTKITVDMGGNETQTAPLPAGF